MVTNKKKKKKLKKRQSDENRIDQIHNVANASINNEQKSGSKTSDEHPESKTVDNTSSKSQENQSKTEPNRREKQKSEEKDDASDPPENDSREEATSNQKQHQQNPNAFSSIQPALSSCTLEAIADLNFQRMTPVQKAVIPLFLTNKDVSVQAVTGSGKTCAFIIPMVEMILRLETLLKKTEVGGLVISPTRELARQTYDIACHFCSYAKISKPILLVGGARTVLEDVTLFQTLGSDIVIATPGRLEDIITRYDVMLFQTLECLILDEADVLLDMGFEITLTSILRKLPKMRRTGLFSATTNQNRLKNLVRAGLRNPVTIHVAVQDKTKSKSLEEISKSATPVTLTNYYSICKLTTKLNQLVHFLTIQLERGQKCICFFLSCAHVEFYHLVLTHLLNQKKKESDRYYIEPLHGKKVQKRREKTMERYRQVSSGVLLCTDIAARGLDITDVNWVIQFDAPTDPASFVHRVGRSARAGKKGKSVIFLTRKEESYVDFLRKRKIPLSVLPEEEGGVCKSHDNDSERETEENEVEPDEIEIKDILPVVKDLVMKDRDVLEKGTKAFTAHIRAYKEHKCAFIFRFASLNLGHLATSFALLRLPKMPELRTHVKAIDFQPAPLDVNIHGIPYLDKQREAARQKRLAKELAAGGKNAKQIKAEQRIADRARREKERKEEARKRGLRDPDKKRKGRNQQLMEEWDELAKEERLHKKLKRGKISREEYGRLMYGDSKQSDDDESEDDE